MFWSCVLPQVMSLKSVLAKGWRPQGWKKQNKTKTNVMVWSNKVASFPDLLLISTEDYNQVAVWVM